MVIEKFILDSIKYPLQNIKRLIILYILFLTSFLIIPVFLAFGYLLRIMAQTINDSNDLPAFNEWRIMFINGLKFFAVNYVYFIIPSVILFLLVGVILVPVIHLAVYLFFVTIGFFALIFTLALMNMAYKQRFSEAFNYRNILQAIRLGRQKILIYIILFLAVETLGGLIFLLRSLALNNLIMSLILTLIFTYTAIFWARFTGLNYNNLMKK